MLPDPGCYEERYQRGPAVRSLATGLLLVGFGLLWHPLLAAALTGVLLAIPAVLTLALPRVAFRADHAGITLGPDRLLPRRRAVFIPWTDVENIILPGYKGIGQARYIGVQRRDGAPALPYGNEPAPGFSVPGVMTGATRRVMRWRLDRGRLAAVIVAVAPGVRVTEDRPDRDGRIEGPGQRQDRLPRAG